MSSRPDIALALDVRSYERIVVIAKPDSEYAYPEEWSRPASLSEAIVDDHSVVIVDRVDVAWKSFAALAAGHPRLFAFAVNGVEQEKKVRRMITALFPWNEVWTVWTSFGKTLITKDARGEAVVWEAD
ncbi:MAG: hypothetical protein JO112_19920 [Planctomycetes bacterium]|nr:hypothetical protein [Planctomycetota bacterium]